MTDENESRHIERASDEQKRPYEAPRITESARFETLAEGCAYKDEGDCFFNLTE